jgi:hypothetical protein
MQILYLGSVIKEIIDNIHSAREWDDTKMRKKSLELIELSSINKVSLV